MKIIVISKSSENIEHHILSTQTKCIECGREKTMVITTTEDDTKFNVEVDYICGKCEISDQDSLAKGIKIIRH